jgi:serine/threonine protein kinase
MTNRQLDEEAIFHIARRITDRQARADYLEQVCGDNTALLTRVRALLEVHEQEQNFLRSAGPEATATLDAEPITEAPGTEIGRYRLMEQIGEGGMGVVFVAEQRQPLRRKVALKVIKPGMDSKAVVARFEAERQALALMDHPNIAHVLDAGSTAAGRPYFVMEYVRGVPITEYCDQNRLTIRERLELFIQVCQAIQHAHQKGIVHRDIKPSNVLVTLHDGVPVPKVIDFGVAKALNTRLTDRTIYTAHMQVIGTLMYMSPEQAEMSGLDVDTRADVYGLGVLLYELLTGTTPFQKEELDQAGFDEQRRIIREKEPQRASMRISSLGETATTIAEQRKTDARKLHQQVRGDLDWIVMKALEKDRTRRCETASGFAADVQRFLGNEPIEARSPSSIYRFSKLALRHRMFVAATFFVMTTLIAGIVATSHFATQLSVTLGRLHDELIEKVILNAQSRDRASADAAIQLALESRVPVPTLHMLKGIACYYDGDNPSAIDLLERVVDVEPNNVTARAMLALSHVHNGGWPTYTRQMARIQATKETAERRDHEALILGCTLLYVDTDRCLKMLQETVDRHPEWVVARAMLGGGKAHRALELPSVVLAQDALEETKLAQQVLPTNRVVALYNVWAHSVAIYFAQMQGEDFEHLAQTAERSLRLLKRDANYVAGAYNVAMFYEVIGDFDAALAVMNEAVGAKDHDA